MPLPVDPFNVSKTLFTGKSLIVLKLAQQSGFTAATSTITKTAHNLNVGDQVHFVSGTGFTGLTGGTAYYVIAVPTADTFQVSATSGGSAIAVGTSTAGIFRPIVIFGSKLLTPKLDQQIVDLKRPDAAGVLRKARSVLTEQNESFTFEVDEVKRLLSVFNGSLAGRVTGNATIYCPDPDDVSGNVSLKSEADFPCTVTRDGDLSIGNSEFSKATFNLESNKTTGAITWSADVVA